MSINIFTMVVIKDMVLTVRQLLTQIKFSNLWSVTIYHYISLNYPTDGLPIDEDNPDSVNIIDSDNSGICWSFIIENGRSNYDPEEDDLENDDMS